ELVRGDQPPAGFAHGSGHGQRGGGLCQPVAAVALAAASRRIPTPGRMGAASGPTGPGMPGHGGGAAARTLVVAVVDPWRAGAHAPMASGGPGGGWWRGVHRRAAGLGHAPARPASVA